jgi:hypothetical protein
MKKFSLTNFGLFCSFLLLIGCTNDLNTDPKDQNLTEEQLLEVDPTLAGLVSKVYGSFALSGASGPGSTDTPGDDAGESPFLRGIINLQDFTADDMKNRWGDNGLDQLTTTSDWDENNKFFRYLYNRVYYTVPQCNLLINQVNQYDISNKEQVKSELRFLRSLAYFYLIDCFGKGVLLRETDPVTSDPKPESSRLQLFNFVESELLDIEDKLPNRISYGRANKNVVRMLLAKLYLNAEVYTGSPKYDKALQYCDKIINEGGYQLAPNFVSLFSGDNDVSNAKDEIIYALIADPLNSQSYGNTTYLVNGSLNNDTMVINDFGASEGWAGHRATKAWYGKFTNASGGIVTTGEQLANSSDDRAKLFWSNYLSTDPTKVHNFEMNDYKKWIDGFPSTKFRNSNFIGTSSPTGFSNTDFPLYRLADVYLMYAECALRSGTGSTTLALQYVNAVRNRSNAASITLSDLTLDFILDERARELNFEGHRRTDLVRYGRFGGGSYIWPWKGGVKDGTAIPTYYNLFPIPLSARGANPNLTQNDGY